MLAGHLRCYFSPNDGARRSPPESAENLRRRNLAVISRQGKCRRIDFGADISRCINTLDDPRLHYEPTLTCTGMPKLRLPR